MVLLRLILVFFAKVATQHNSAFNDIFGRVSIAGWSLLALAGTALTCALARSLGARPAARLAWWAGGVGALDAATTLMFAVQVLGGPDWLAGLDGKHTRAAVVLVPLLLSLCFDLLFWFAFTRIVRDVPSRNTTIAYLVVRAAGLLLALPSVLPYELYKSLFLSSKWLGDTMMWTRFALAFVCALMVISALSAVSKSFASDSGAPSFGVLQAPGRASPQRDMAVGAAWILGGVIFTLISYSTASGGGRYVVTTGAFAYGVVRLIRGLFRAGNSG
jgi:hypothetical protein